MSNETAMQIGRVYLVVLDGGNVYFGKLEKRFHGCCLVGGFFSRFICGIFDESQVRRVIHFDSPKENEPEWEWLNRIDMETP